MIVRTALALCLATASATVFAQTKWDFPTGYATTNYHYENIAQFVKEVDAETSGKLKIAVHPNGSLFKLPEIKRAVQSSQAAIGEVILSAFSNEDPIYGLDSVPFLASSYDEAARLMRVSRPALEERFAKQGLKLLFSVPWPPQGLYSNKALASIADLRGSKWRAYNPYTARMAEIIGATPVTIQAAELTQALATGVVQSFVSSPSMGVDSRVWETQVKYYYDVRAWLPRNVVFVNQKALDALDPPVRDALLKAAAVAEKRGWDMSDEKARWYRDQLKSNGMQVLEPSDALRSDFRKLGDTMVADWLKAAGADGQKIIDAYRKP